MCLCNFRVIYKCYYLTHLLAYLLDYVFGYLLSNLHCFIETVIRLLLFRLQRLSPKAFGTTETPIAGGLSSLLVSIGRSFINYFIPH